MSKGLLILKKALVSGVLFIAVYVLVNSSLDIYNNFAYDRAILKYTPYGYMPILSNPYDYHSEVANVKGGDFVYVEDWTSAYNGRIVFARVKSKLSTGYVNQEMLVETNINVKPVISVLLLSMMFVYLMKRFYSKYHTRYHKKYSY